MKEWVCYRKRSTAYSYLLKSVKDAKYCVFNTSASWYYLTNAAAHVL